MSAAFRPSETRRRFYNDLTRAMTGITERSNVTNIRPSQHEQAVAAGHPSAQPFDRDADPDVPVLPLLQRLALSVLVRSVLVPGSVPRSEQVAAATTMHAYFRPDADDAPAHGYPRPQGAS